MRLDALSTGKTTLVFDRPYWIWDEPFTGSDEPGWMPIGIWQRID
jgi:hypothetical protein